MLRKVREVLVEVPAHEPLDDVVERLGVDRAIVQDERREALDVALDDVVRVKRQLLREAGVPETTKERVAVLQASRPRLRAHRELRGPRMAQHRLVRRNGNRTNLRPPVDVRAWDADFRQRRVEDPIEQVLLVRDVVVKRHRLHPELFGELAHAERLDPVFVRERDRRPEDAFPAQGRAARGCRSAHRLDNLQRTQYLTPYAYSVDRK